MKEIARQKVVAYRKKNPCTTLAAIGDKCGVSRERVRQILKSSNLPTRHYIQNQNVCNFCGSTFDIKGNPKRVFCSFKCRQAYAQIILVCDNCGKEFKRLVSNMRGRLKQLGTSSLIFCSKKCQGHWLGKTNAGKKRGSKESEKP